MILNFLEFFEFQLSYHAYFYIPVKLFLMNSKNNTFCSKTLFSGVVELE